MPIQSIPLGMLTPLVMNQIYALPSVQCSVYTDAAAPGLQQSNSASFTANNALVMTAGSTNVFGGFLRATTAGVNVILKRQ